MLDFDILCVICAYSKYYEGGENKDMPQLYLYVPKEVAEKVHEKARERNMTVSHYLAEVVRKEVAAGWPDGYFEEVCGKWEGEFPEIAREKPENSGELF